MFFIPSKQIPPVFDAKVVVEDFDLLCDAAGKQLGISPRVLSETLRQVAEEELTRRLEYAIDLHTAKKQKKDPIRCSEPGCIVKKITKPQYIERKVYCTFHYRQRQTQAVKELELQLEHTSLSPLESPQEISLWKTPKSVYLPEHESFWTFSRIMQPEEHKEYRYHKPTGLVIHILSESSSQRPFQVELIGRYYNHSFIDKSLLSQEILDWCIDSQLTL